MSSVSLKGLGVLLLLVFLVSFSTFDSCDGRRGKHRRQNKVPSSSLAKKKGKGKIGGGHQHGGGGQTSPTPSPGEGCPAAKQAATFDVLDFGAKGDGTSDDTKVAYIILI